MIATRQTMLHMMLLFVLVNAVLASACGEDDAIAGLPGAAAQSAVAAEATAESQETPSEPAANSTSEPPPVMSTQGWEGATTGIPAIVPSLPVVTGQPAFTDQDVRDYVAHHPPPYTDTNEAIIVKRVEFLPVEDVEVRINHGIAVPRGALLCLVTIQGKWVPPPFVTAVGTQNPNSVLYMIYDAQTGNYLAETSGIESD